MLNKVIALIENISLKDQVNSLPNFIEWVDSDIGVRFCQGDKPFAHFIYQYLAPAITMYNLEHMGRNPFDVRKLSVNPEAMSSSLPAHRANYPVKIISDETPEKWIPAPVFLLDIFDGLKMIMGRSRWQNGINLSMDIITDKKITLEDIQTIVYNRLNMPPESIKVNNLILEERAQVRDDYPRFKSYLPALYEDKRFVVYSIEIKKPQDYRADYAEYANEMLALLHQLVALYQSKD